jgi:fatty acid desaturase
MYPHNDGCHVVHHIHSQVPFHQLSEAYAALVREKEKIRKVVMISRSIGETFWQMTTKRILWKRTVGRRRRVNE